MINRATVYRVLEKSNHTDRAGRAVDIFLIILITVNVICVVLETVHWIYARFQLVFEIIDMLSVAAFTVEYVLRVWSSVEREPGQPALSQRLRYMVSPLALIDLLAIVPFYISYFVVFDLRFLRVMRLLRIFKLTRYSTAMTMLLDVFRQEASAFFAGFFILVVLLILAASGAYLVEQEAQPVKFGSIPDAMWWAVATLTTVGYGDVTPITPLGKLFGAGVTIIGIGMAALPAGILASGLADQLRRKREALSQQYRRALEDGTIDAAEHAALEAFRKDLGLSRALADEILHSVQDGPHRSRARHCPHCGKALSRASD